MTRTHALMLPALLLAALIIGTASLPTPWTSAAVVPTHPLIIVPTTLTSFPTDSGLEFDPIFHIYDNIIETFTQNGYVEGETLFVLEYDWQQSMEDTASELSALVDQAKASCPGCSASTTVDIVGHGQGGLVAWEYTSEPLNSANVNKLVFLGAPLRGTAAAYVGAEGGQFTLHSSRWGQQVGQALLDAQAQEAGYGSTFEYVAAEVPAFTQLLPIETYLFNAGADYPDAHPSNLFLENLWNVGFPAATTFVGLAPQDHTPTGYDITLPSSQPPLWEHGEPGAPFLGEGDGLALFSSLETWVAIDGTYGAKSFFLPTAAQADIFELLTGEVPTTVSEVSYPIECALFVHAHGGVDMQITDPNGDRLGKDFSNGNVLTEIDESLYSGYEDELEYAIIANPDGLYNVTLEGTETSTYTINSVLACGEDEGEALQDEESGTTEPGEEDELDLTIEDGGVILDPPAPPNDTGVPAVTITSPAEGAAHTQDEEVFAAATIVDPEGSAIATTTYTLNGTPINPALAMPLEDEPLGLAVMAVSATDAAGNTGSSSVSFTIAPAAPPDTAAPVITITSPVEGQAYLSDNTSTFLTATIEDESPIATTSYRLNGALINPADPLPFFDAPLGAANASVAATDVAGNTATATVSFIIAAPPPPPDSYTIEFLPPISAKCYIPSHKTGISKIWKYLFARLHLHYKFNPFVKRFVDCSDPSIFKAGSNVPVKFKVKNDEGQYVQLPGAIAWIEPVKGPTLNSPIDEMEYQEQPSSGYFYEWQGSHYQFNWKTLKSAKGYWYHLFVVLPDGSIHQTVLGLR